MGTKLRQIAKKAIGSMVDAAMPIVSSVLLLELDLTTALKVVAGAGIVCVLRGVAEALQAEKNKGGTSDEF